MVHRAHHPPDYCVPALKVARPVVGFGRGAAVRTVRLPVPGARSWCWPDGPHLPGFIAANIHVSAGGARVVNYAQRETAEALRPCLKTPARRGT